MIDDEENEIDPLDYICEIRPLLPQLTKALSCLLNHPQKNNKTIEIKDAVIYGFFVGFFLSKTKIHLNEEKMKEMTQIYINCKYDNQGYDDDDVFLEELNSFLCTSIASSSNPNPNPNQIIVNNPIEKESIPSIDIKTCKICIEDFNLLDEFNYCLDCGCIIHYPCFDKHVSIQITNNQFPIKCPICNIEVTSNHIEDSLAQSNSDLIQKYHKYTLNNFAIANNKEYSCCPTPGCDFLFSYNDQVIYFKCELCHKDYCLNCQVDWHDALTCAQFRQKQNKKIDDEFIIFAQGMNFKKCPRCHMWVEKKEGCNHMTCRCKKEFCYKCGGDYSSTHEC